jgi:hypothetical protein
VHRHIALLEWKVRGAAARHEECADALVTQLWAWESARDQLCVRFGKKFIRIPFPHSS